MTIMSNSSCSLIFKVNVDIDINRLFRTEVETMSHYVHENLLALLAFSADGPACCLVYSFIPNGSLEARLACEVLTILKY